ncbi:unnamed protein product [Rhizoctonia solani]|uniref:AMP-dependent synthetase/ligase domain-containing protein n=1 Tax=Rhizoctonia solani TaxID=456999 RepID=A0A8H3B7H7_9AGAM|nr:unnamed protein product [Rhizoctonia solani]
MVSFESSQLVAGAPYVGPLGNEPLTDDELAILLAIPRGAEKTPDATALRLPLGPDPAHGWVDVTFSEARAIVARLAADWKNRLSDGTQGRDVGPGTTVCLLVQPIVHAIFHWLAFWALGCTVQLVSLTMGDENIPIYLKKSECQTVIYSSISDTLEQRLHSDFNGAMIQLSEEEYAHRLAQNAKCSHAEPNFPWPEPRRPDPAIILHSSGSTGAAKLLQFSLYFYSLNFSLIRNSNTILDNTPDSRPFLLFSPQYWQSFGFVLTAQLAARAPIAFTHVPDISQFPSNRFIDWVRGLGVGGLICAPRFIRDILASGSEANIKYLQGLSNIVVGGSVLDESTATLAERYKLRLTNGYGSTEMGIVLCTSQPPYTHLRPLPKATPIVLPISETEPDGSRQVQLWYSQTTSPEVAHLSAKGDVPLKFEPFPGQGPHEGEPAVTAGDIFTEVRESSEPAYVYLGRNDDLMKLAGNGGWDINAATYETELTSAVTSRLSSECDGASRWSVDGVQLFGNNRPCTALVIQLCPINQDPKSEIPPELLERLSELAESVNAKLKLGPKQRVDVRKRMLVITPEGKAYGPGIHDGGNVPRLMTTHKHTLQRWKNVQAFESWLDGLDYTES